MKKALVDIKGVRAGILTEDENGIFPKVCRSDCCV